MFSKTLPLLALAGAALVAAAPAANPQDVHVVYETVMYTVVEGQQPETPAPQQQTRTRHRWSHPPASATAVPVVSSAPAQSSAAPVVPSATPVKPSATPVKPSSAPAATPTGTTGSTGTYMDIVNEWRGKLGKKPFEQDSSLEANDLKCLQANPGQMVHILNSGSFAQVLAPGKPEDFLHVFVGGWLCEKPNMAGMDGICASQSSGWAYDSTGHADILSSDSYTKIGCSNSNGIWGCDLK